MATYVILNLIIIGVVLFMLRVWTIPYHRAWFVTFGSLLALTVIFDNLIIYFNIVGYNTAKILGVYIGLAPIEDFFYSFLAVFLIPCLWHTLEKRYAF